MISSKDVLNDVKELLNMTAQVKQYDRTGICTDAHKAVYFKPIIFKFKFNFFIHISNNQLA